MTINAERRGRGESREEKERNCADPAAIYVRKRKRIRKYDSVEGVEEVETIEER